MYPYGSTVYGTNVKGSDEDIITVLTRVNDRHQIIDREVDGRMFSFVTHDKTSFQRGLWAHEIYALECYWLPDAKVLKYPKEDWDFKLNLEHLRISLSEKTSHSWVKAKKKFGEGDIVRGKKSLFHSLRILKFGIQIATEGKLVNYQDGVDLWWEIYTNPSLFWTDYEKLYKKLHNELSSKFRSLTPK